MTGYLMMQLWNLLYVTVLGILFYIWYKVSALIKARQRLQRALEEANSPTINTENDRSLYREQRQLIRQQRRLRRNDRPPSYENPPSYEESRKMALLNKESESITIQETPSTSTDCEAISGDSPDSES